MADATGDPDMDALLGVAPAPTAAMPHSTGDADIDAVISGTPKPAAKKTEKQKALEDLDRGPDSAAAQTIHHIVSGMGHGIYGGYKGLLALGTGQGADAAADAVNAETDKTYQPTSKGGKTGTAIVESKYNPINWPQAGADWAADKSADLGAPPSVSTAIKTSGAAIPAAFGLRGMFGRGAAAEAAQPALPPPRTALVPTEQVPVLQATSVQTPQLVRPAAGPKVGQSGAPAALQAPEAAAPAPTAVQTPAPGVQPPNTAQPPQKLLTFDQDQPFVEDKQQLPPDEQQRRADVLRRTLGDIEVRKSALTGDAQAAADEYQTSQLNSPAGQHLSNVIQGERTGLENKVDQIQRDQGGTQGHPENQTVKIQRGNNVYAPLEALQDHFDGVTNAAYEAAREKHGETPVKLDTFHDAMHDDSLMTDPDRVQLRSALDAFTSKLKVKQEDGSIAGNVGQAETIRKYLGKNWSPKTSGYIGELKDALEDDVSKAAGSDVFAAARAARTMKGKVFDDPKGMAQIMDVNGPNGINRKVYPEQLPDKILSMPVPQMNHIVSTLEGVTDPKIKPMADKALAELRTHLVSKIGQEGKSTASLWNARGVTDELNNNSERVQRLLPKQTQDDLADVNEAGHILKKRQGYPGAYVQEHNIVSSGFGKALRAGAAGAGGLIGSAAGPGGTVAGGGLGSMLGNMLGGKADAAASLRAAKARTVRLPEFDPNAK